MTKRHVPFAVLAAVFVVSLVQVRCVGPRDIRLEALGALVDGQRTYMGDPGPSIDAAARLARYGRVPIYDADLSRGTAFIYPPLAAALYRPLVHLPPPLAHQRLMQVNHVMWVLIFLALLALLAGGALDRRLAWQEIAGALAVMVGFYPLLHAVELNQSMVLATLLLGGTWVAVDRGHDRVGGVMLACAFLVKPQLVLVLPVLWWHARPLVIAALATSAVLAVASLIYAGVANHVDYATNVLPTLSQGYAYYANQSWAGMLLRFDAGLDYADFRLPGEHGVIQVLAAFALVASVVGAVVMARRAPRDRRGRLLVLSLAWLAVTLSSPISWQHHYAPALFVAITLWRERERARPVVVWLGGVGFALVASYFEVRELTSSVERVSASYVLAGGALLAAAVVLCLRDARANDASATVQRGDASSASA